MTIPPHNMTITVQQHKTKRTCQLQTIIMNGPTSSHRPPAEQPANYHIYTNDSQQQYDYNNCLQLFNGWHERITLTRYWSLSTWPTLWTKPISPKYCIPAATPFAMVTNRFGPNRSSFFYTEWSKSMTHETNQSKYSILLGKNPTICSPCTPWQSSLAEL